MAAKLKWPEVRYMIGTTILCPTDDAQIGVWEETPHMLCVSSIGLDLRPNYCFEPVCRGHRYSIEFSEERLALRFIRRIKDHPRRFKDILKEGPLLLLVMSSDGRLCEQLV